MIEEVWPYTIFKNDMYFIRNNPVTKDTSVYVLDLLTVKKTSIITMSHIEGTNRNNITISPTYPVYLFTYENDIYLLSRYQQASNKTMLSKFLGRSFVNLKILDLCVEKTNVVQINQFLFISSDVANEEYSSLFVFDINNHSTHYIGGRISQQSCSVLYEDKLYFFGRNLERNNKTSIEVVFFHLNNSTFGEMKIRGKRFIRSICFGTLLIKL